MISLDIRNQNHKKHSIFIALSFSLILLFLSSCGEKETEENESFLLFRNQVDQFCDQIYELDESINSYDIEDPDAKQKLFADLDQLTAIFEQFSSVDFPTEFDYLENLADEGSAYMLKADESFKDALSNETYNVESMETVYHYAEENYARAFKRIQIMITFLNGDMPDDVTLESE